MIKYYWIKIKYWLRYKILKRKPDYISTTDAIIDLIPTVMGIAMIMNMVSSITKDLNRTFAINKISWLWIIGIYKVKR